MFWLGAIVALSALIIVHEAGHYLVAKWCKMRVDRFSLGFGPALIGWRRKGTLFQIAPIPFGGFVEIRGMNIAEEVDPHDIYAYPNRPVWQRFLTIFAGPATNYLFAIFLAFVLFTTAGIKTGNEWYSVSRVNDDFDAQGKLVAGDKITGITLDGADQPVPLGTPGYRLIDVVESSKGEQLTVTVERDGQSLDFQIVPKKDTVEDIDPETGETVVRERYLLGIIMQRHPERAEVGFFTAVGEAFMYPVGQTQRILEDLYLIVTGKREGEITGPVGIASFIRDAIEAGWITALWMLMVLNVYLGLFNLLPLPALDGGRLAFLVYEMATRKRANPKIEAPVHMVGIMLLMLVLVVVTFKDCANLFS